MNGMPGTSPMTRDRGRLQGEGDPSPITVAGRGPPVLALHGWGGTPLEVELVTDVARELGLASHAPLLPGHGTHAAELGRTGFADWAGAARAALEDLTSEHGPAIVVGLSMGSLVAMQLAVCHPEPVLALGLLSNAAWLHAPFPTLALRAVDRLHLPDFNMPKAGADIADPEARKTHVTYGTQPIHSAIEVMRAGERLRRALGHIRVPTLVVHAKRDRVCPVRNAHRVHARLGTADKRLVILPRSRHIVTRDLERDQVRVELHRFFQRFAARGGSSSSG